MNSPTQIFICYSPKDATRVEELYLKLYQEGFRPWMDRKDISSVSDRKSNIQKAIRESDFFLLCLSTNAFNDENTIDRDIQAQLNFLWKGSDRGTYLIPIRLEDCRVPVTLEAFDIVDLFQTQGWENLLKQIEEVKTRRIQIEKAFDYLSESSEPSASSTLEESEVDFLPEGPENTSSVFDWSIELRRIMNGEREEALIRLGSVEEYIEVLLAESEDLSLAQPAFQEALNNLVQAWQPSVAEPDYSVALMLELIGLYKPPEGVIKVISLLRKLKYFRENIMVNTHDSEEVDLHLKALVVLESYYSSAPKPPADESPAYKTYIDLLKEDLLNPRYSSYVAGRILDLRSTELRNLDLEYVIKRYPEAVKGLVKVLAEPSRRSIAERDLAYVFTYCLEGGIELVQAFEQAITFIAGQMVLEDMGPDIYLQNDLLRLILPEESMYKYWEVALNMEGEKGLKKYSSIRSAAD